MTRRVTRTEHDGRLTVLADRVDGQRLNSPNDITCRRRDGSLWFTDPPFGIQGWWEGEAAPAERPQGVYRIDPAADGRVTLVLDDLAAPNGLAFSPDERMLYVVESRATPSRRIWAYDVGDAGRLTGKRLHLDADGAGALDGIAVDTEGRLWCGWGSDGRPGADPVALDGVRVFDRRRPAHRPHPPARALRQPVFWRRPAQPPVHGGHAFGVHAGGQCPRGGLSPLGARLAGAVVLASLGLALLARAPWARAAVTSPHVAGPSFRTGRSGLDCRPAVAHRPRRRATGP